MRPKVVILIVVCAFGLLVAIAALKGVAGRNGGSQGDLASGGQGDHPGPPAVPTVDKSKLSTSGTAAPASEEVRAALIEKEMDQIRELQSQSDETNNPAIIAALIQKMSNPESEVRKAALEALRQMNDTNAIPALRNVEASITDPREKVAVLDTIDYLLLPPTFPAPGK